MSDSRQVSCPACGAAMNVATGLNHGKPPEPGDLSLCIECGQICRFGDSFTLLAITPEQARLLLGPDWPTLDKARKYIFARRN